MANTLTGTPAAAAIYVQVRTRAARLAVRPCLAAVSAGRGTGRTAMPQPSAA